VTLQQHGIRILRFWNNDVLARTEDVLTEIANALSSLTPISQVERLEAEPPLTPRPLPTAWGEGARQPLAPLAGRGVGVRGAFPACGESESVRQTRKGRDNEIGRGESK
jgi:hypothetical protein